MSSSKCTLCFCSVFPHWNSHLYACTQLAKLWLQLLHLKEEEAVDKKELLQLWQQMAQLLLDCLNEEEQHSEIQQLVSFPQVWTVFKRSKHSWISLCDVSSSCLFVQLVTAFEKALSLMDAVPGEEHKKVSVDYIRCLSKVILPQSHPHNC